jgi:hypothetical protein
VAVRVSRAGPVLGQGQRFALAAGVAEDLRPLNSAFSALPQVVDHGRFLVARLGRGGHWEVESTPYVSGFLVGPGVGRRLADGWAPTVVLRKALAELSLEFGAGREELAERNTVT